jgi:hypothetical protein
VTDDYRHEDPAAVEAGEEGAAAAHFAELEEAAEHGAAIVPCPACTRCACEWGCRRCRGCERCCTTGLVIA